MHSAWRAKGSRAPFSPLSNNVGSPPRPATKSAAPGVCDASHVALLIGTPFRSVATSGAGGAALAGFAGRAAAAATASWARRAASGFAGSHRRGAASAAVEVAAQTQIVATSARRLCMPELCQPQQSALLYQRSLVAEWGALGFCTAVLNCQRILTPGARVWGDLLAPASTKWAGGMAGPSAHTFLACFQPSECRRRRLWRPRK